MNTDLPSSEEYCRLTHARELREKADRLNAWVEWWAGGPSENEPWGGVAAWGVAGVILTLPLAWIVPLGLALLGGPAAAILAYAAQMRAQGMCRTADELEAQHQARYGSSQED